MGWGREFEWVVWPYSHLDNLESFLCTLGAMRAEGSR